MLLPYKVDVPMERLPLTNWILIAVTVVVSLVILAGESKKREIEIDPEKIWEELKQPGLSEEQQEKLIQRWQQQRQEINKRLAEPAVPPWSLQPEAFSVWQLFSYQFVHGSLLHLIGNMIFLFVFGNAVNAKIGHGLFIISYLLLGALGGMAWLLLGNGVPLVGASGAIMGIVGIFLILFPQNDVSIFYVVAMARAGTHSFPSGWLILCYFVGDLVGCLFGGAGPVAYVTHLGSTVGGVLAGVGLLWFRVVRSTAYEKNLLQMIGVEPPPRRKKRKKRAPKIPEVPQVEESA